MAMHFHLPLLLLLVVLPLPNCSCLGINYGQVANNLPPPSTVLPLLQPIGVTKVKLYDTDPNVLNAFANTGIEFIVGLPDQLVTKIASNPSESTNWVKSNILPYLPATKITTITVGNEVLTGNDVTNIQCLLPAMESLHTALVSLNLDNQICVTTPHSLAVLFTSYPPSSGTFRPDINPYMTKILSFLAKTGSPFLINAYPYFAYKADPNGIKLDYVLFESTTDSAVVDSKTGFKYENMLFAQVDAVLAAIEAAVGKEKGKKVDVIVSETGWPSKGDVDEPGSTKENARKYNGNLMRLVEEEKSGTPMRPDTPLEVYIFALFNENLKPGPTSERNYGLYKPNGTPVYQLFKVKTTEKNETRGPTGNNYSPIFYDDSYTTSSAAKVMVLCYFGMLTNFLPLVLLLFGIN